MSSLFAETLNVVRAKLREYDPAKADALYAKTGAIALCNPDDSRNIFTATLHWPTGSDPISNVGLRANYPGERLKNGQGYLGVTFSHGEYVDPARIHTKVKVRYGIGSIGLLEPMGTYMTEVLEGAAGNETEPLWSPASPNAAAITLAKFGIIKS